VTGDWTYNASIEAAGMPIATATQGGAGQSTLAIHVATGLAATFPMGSSM